MMRSLMAACSAAVLVAAACATEPPPLDKTQDESIHKSMFDGEWYYKVTVIDTEWNNQYTFIGEELATYYGGAWKIRWEITQDYLNGYMVPQKYLDPDGNPVENTIGRESLALSFRIERHFDIKYLQNNTTREDLNVIVENTDREWDEREYMIVDWSKNLATNFWAPLGSNLAAGDLVVEPMSSWQNVEFFDVENQRINTKKWRPGKDPDIYVVNIDQVMQVHSPLRYWWQIYYGWGQEPTKIKFRISMMKKNPEGLAERQYQPMEYRDELFRRFGYFRTEFETYDPLRGPLESQKQYLINRWDLGCYQDESSGEERCKKIIFHMSPSMPTPEEDPDLYQWTLDALKVWNDALQEATGRTDQIVELRENEIMTDEDGDPVYSSDGTLRYRYELGDLRYNFINYVTKPLSYAPLGYGPSTPDGDTGEIINGNVNIYGNWIDYVIERSMDLYDVVAGNCTMEDIMAGHYWNDDTGQCDGGNPGIVAKDGGGRKVDMHFLTPALRTSYWPKGDINKPARPFDVQEHEAMRPIARQLFLEKQRTTPPLDLGKLGIVEGTRFEEMMVPHATFGSTFRGATSVDQVINDFSPAVRLSEKRLREVKELYDKRSKACQTEPDEYESNILAFIEEMADQPRDQVKRELRRWIIFTSIVHEMGHVIGLRHNFRGSVDKINFPNEFHVEYNEYWNRIEELRDQYGDAIDSGDASAYEAYTEAVNRIPSAHERHASTSIMDYHGYFEGWLPKVASYDRAALLFGYGKKVEIREGNEWVVADYEQGDFVKDDVYDYAAESESGRVVRYYMFCSDERTWDDFFCMRHDRGTTAVEIVRNMIRDQYRSYFFRNFKRDSTLFESRRDNYYWYKWLRLYYPYAKAFAQVTVHSIWYDEFWDSLWDGMGAIAAGPEEKDMTPGYKRNGGEDLLRAQLYYYYYLMYDVLMRPDYGLYELVYDAFGNRYWESTEEQYTTADSITARVDPGPGWGWVDKWDNQYDTEIYYDKLIRIGVELDKVVAYEILSIPCVLNDYLWHEKANGNTYWGDLWNGDGMQLWKVTRGFITDIFAHDQNPWCMDEEGNLQAQPVDPLEGAVYGGLMDGEPFQGETRCPAGTYPVQPGMDALFAIYPIFYGVSGSQHPWYHNHLSDYMDSQVKGGNHRFDIPYEEGTPEYEEKVAEFLNSTGTKTYQAVNTEDGLSVSYQLVDKGRRIANRVRMVQACDNGEEPELGAIGTHDRTCAEVMACFSNNAPAYCDPEGWESLYLYPSLAWRDLDRVEAMLIMMQDMIDLAGHYAWRTPGYLDEPY
jgi:hypothetical protein